MNEIVNKYFLAGYKFMPEIFFRQPRFTYNACGLFNKNKGSIKNLLKQEVQDIFTETS